MENVPRLCLYETMLRIRRFEETVAQLFASGRMGGFLHLCIGQEASEAGAACALREDDYITSTHRGHGHVLAKGARMKYMMAELYGRATGYCGGKGGSMHIASRELGILGANGIVGAGFPLAAGAGMSARLLKNGKVTLSFFGDGATAEGSFHESMNLAATFRLPVVYLCENNLYGVGTRQDRVRKTEKLADRAVAYGMPGIALDGNDVEAVYLAAVEAVDRARSGEGPSFIECATYRWHTHFEGEPDTYRPPEEVALWKSRDPIAAYRRFLADTVRVDEAALTGIEAAVEREVDEAVSFAESSPLPEAADALLGVFA
jgi:pyruvate dehydrogenase E1 component alpha subunit